MRADTSSGAFPVDIAGPVEDSEVPLSVPSLIGVSGPQPACAVNSEATATRPSAERRRRRNRAPPRRAGSHDAEGALRQAHDELERRVEERTEQLARANEALREADRRKDEFLATLAHELRNPLAPISNSLQLLKMPRVDAAMVQQTLEGAVRALTRVVLGPAPTSAGLATFYERYVQAARVPALREQVVAGNAELRGLIRQALERCGHPVSPSGGRLLLAALDGLVLTAVAEGADDPVAAAVRPLARLLDDLSG